MRGEAAALLAHEGITGIDDPLEALGRLATEVLAMKDALAARVNAINEIRYEGQGAEQLRAEVALYERALDRSARLLDTLAKHNWTERRVELEQERAELVVTAFLEALRVLALVPVDRDLAVRTFLAGLGRGDALTDATRALPVPVVVGGERA